MKLLYKIGNFLLLFLIISPSQLFASDQYLVFATGFGVFSPIGNPSGSDVDTAISLYRGFDTGRKFNDTSYVFEINFMRIGIAYRAHNIRQRYYEINSKTMTYHKVTHKFPTLNLFPYISDDKTFRVGIFGGSGRAEINLKQVQGSDEITNANSSTDSNVKGIYFDFDELKPKVPGLIGFRFTLIWIETDPVTLDNGSFFDGSGSGFDFGFRVSY